VEQVGREGRLHHQRRDDRLVLYHEHVQTFMDFVKEGLPVLREQIPAR
jgi:hypothetical protein